MIQSPRGYPMARDDSAVAREDQPLDPHVVRSNVGNDLAFLLDTRGQVKACWAAISGTEIVAQDSDDDFGVVAKDGSIGTFSHVETIGPFPLNVLPTGQPEPVYMAVDFAISAAGTGFLFAVLRHSDTDSLLPSVSNPALRDGWTLGYAETTSTSADSMRLRCYSDTTEASDPMLGFLQFPPSLWHHTQNLRGRTLADESATVATCMACVDLYLGRITDGIEVALFGYVLRGCAYGRRSET